MVALLGLLGPATAHGVELKALNEEGELNGPFVQVELAASLLSDAAEKALLAGSFGYAVRGGYRWSDWGLFLHVEHNNWLTTELDTEVVNGAINIGLGGDLTYARGFVHTSLALGASILAFNTALDPAGTTGFFMDLHPVGLRWTVHEYLVLGLDPITFSIVAPVLGGIPLIEIQYRTTLFLEGAF